jgi:hypothetical protein
MRLNCREVEESGCPAIYIPTDRSDRQKKGRDER